MAIGIAIIGSGIFVEEEHLPAVQAVSQLSLKAIYSRSLKSAQSVSKSLSGIDLYSDDSDSGRQYADILKRSDIEAVIIALPIPHQPEYIKQALSAGKHVLAEKPIAKDVETAKELLQWYNSKIDTSKTFFAIAENWRFLERFAYGAQELKSLGKIQNFRMRLNALVKGGKYFETPWRKTPQYQGGFLLDGGVHFIAGIRLLLGQDAKMSKLSAFTSQNQPHLPPIDTANATVQLANGGNGVISMSFGTTFTGAEWTVAGEYGTIDVASDKVTIVIDGKESSKNFEKEGNRVKEEVEAFAQSITNGKLDPRSRPEEALADLEILEAIVKSGESNGSPVDLSLQV